MLRTAGLLLSCCALLASCTLVPGRQPDPAQFDHIVMRLPFLCTDGGEVVVTAMGTAVVLAAAGGSAAYRGAHPTYFGHESTVTFSGGYRSFVRDAPEGRMVCALANGDPA